MRRRGLEPRTDLREFETATDLMKSYADLRARMGRLRPPPKPPKPKPVELPPPLPPQEPPASVLIRRSMMERVMYETCQYFGITRHALISTSRTTTVVVPRSVAMYLAYELLRGDDRAVPVSLPVIGRMFHRDHTTVLNALRKIERRITSDTVIADAVEAIRNRINGQKQ